MASETEFLALRWTSRGTSQIFMGRLERSKTEAIWYVLNEQNQMLKSPFGPETDHLGQSGANPNGALDTFPVKIVLKQSIMSPDFVLW